MQEDHHAEETYRAMTASLVQEQQGAKDLVEVANRLQDRFFCVYLHDPMVKTKSIEAKFLKSPQYTGFYMGNTRTLRTIRT